MTDSRSGTNTPNHTDTTKWYGGFCQIKVDLEDMVVNVDDSLLPRVVCRQLGFSGGRQVRFPRVPPLNQTELVGYLTCTGNEASLSECKIPEGMK